MRGFFTQLTPIIFPYFGGGGTSCQWISSQSIRTTQVCFSLGLVSSFGVPLVHKSSPSPSLRAEIRTWCWTVLGELFRLTKGGANSPCKPLPIGEYKGKGLLFRWAKLRHTINPSGGGQLPTKPIRTRHIIQILQQAAAKSASRGHNYRRMTPIEEWVST